MIRVRTVLIVLVALLTLSSLPAFAQTAGKGGPSGAKGKDKAGKSGDGKSGDSKDKVLPKEPRIERFRKLLDLARRTRAKGKYDAAVAAYVYAHKFAPSRELGRSLMREAGRVLEIQQKYVKALRLYGQNRLEKEELLLLMKTRQYKKAFHMAKLMGRTEYEGEILLAYGKPKKALEVFRLGDNRWGEARALFALGFPGQSADIFASIKRHREAAESYQAAGKMDLARQQWRQQSTAQEQRLIVHVNKIRELRRRLDPEGRRKLGLGDLDAEEQRILRLRLSRLYKKTAKVYQEFAYAQERLGSEALALKLRKQELRFLQLYVETFTDRGRDQFGLDVCASDGTTARVEELKKLTAPTGK